MSIEDIALSFVPSLGVRGAAHLLGCFGSASAIYGASEDELCGQAGLRADVARSIVSRAGMREAEREAEYCRRNGIAVVASTDEEYPPLLRETNDYPSVLYVVGDVSALRRRAVAFVGTRNMSSYGRRMCDELVGGLSELAPDTLIVSGLAYGIDGACHRAALACGLATAGIVANALPAVTPAAHACLAADMKDRGGAIVSELSSQTRRNGRLFIARNRLIAAMCAATVVVESPESGGSLSTAAFADGYGRTVLAVPGRATDEKSRGTNALIRNRKAQLVTSAEDMAAELMWELGLDGVPPARHEPLPLTDQERELLEHFGDDPVSIDALGAASGLSAGELSLLLMNMELSGAVRQLPGKRYEKCRGV